MEEAAKVVVKTGAEVMVSLVGEKEWELGAAFCAKNIPSQMVNSTICLFVGGTTDQQASAIAQVTGIIPYIQQNMISLDIDGAYTFLNTSLPGTIWTSPDYVWFTLINSTVGSCVREVSCIFTLSNVTASATTAVENLATAACEASQAAAIAAARAAGYIAGEIDTAAIYNRGIAIGGAVAGVVAVGVATYLTYTNRESISTFASKCFKGLFGTNNAAIADVEAPSVANERSPLRSAIN